MFDESTIAGMYSKNLTTNNSHDSFFCVCSYFLIAICQYPKSGLEGCFQLVVKFLMIFSLSLGHKIHHLQYCTSGLKVRYFEGLQIDEQVTPQTLLSKELRVFRLFQLLGSLGDSLKPKLPEFRVQFTHKYRLVELQQHRGICFISCAHLLGLGRQIGFLTSIEELVISHLTCLQNRISLARSSQFIHYSWQYTIIITDHTLIVIIILVIFTQHLSHVHQGLCLFCPPSRLFQFEGR